jgi:hypothetical protein
MVTQCSCGHVKLPLIIMAMFTQHPITIPNPQHCHPANHPWSSSMTALVNTSPLAHPCQHPLLSPTVTIHCHCQTPSHCHCQCPAPVNTQSPSTPSHCQCPIILDAPCQAAQCFHQHVKCVLDLLHQVQSSPLSFFWKYERV